MSNAGKPPIGKCGVMSISQVENGYYGPEDARDKHPHIAAIIRAGEIPNTTAERCFINMIGQPNDTDFDPVDQVDGAAPTKLNTYTDGSVRNPSHRFAAIGTYAVYHKEGNTCSNPITNNEREAALTIQESYDSINMKGPLRGAFPSSNRAEAAGILLALTRPMPLNIGVDNALAVRNSNRIINGMQGSTTNPGSSRQTETSGGRSNKRYNKGAKVPPESLNSRAMQTINMYTTRSFPRKIEKEMSSPTAWHLRHMKGFKTTSPSSPTSTATELSSIQNWSMSSSSLYFG